MCLLVAVVIEGIVGGGIERVFDVYAEALVLGEVGVREQDGPLALGKVGFQMRKAVVGLVSATLQRVEQEQMVPGLIQLREVAKVVGESQQVLFAQVQVAELVLEDDAGMEQTVLDNVVRGGNLVFCEGYLSQIVFSVVRVVGQSVVGHRVGRLFNVGQSAIRLSAAYAVDAFLRFRSVHASLKVDHSPVGALPVVGVLALAPLPLERLLTLIDGNRIVEVPLAIALLGDVGRRRAIGGVGAVACSASLLECFLNLGLQSLVALLLFLFLQGINHAVDGLQTLLLRHLCQFLQRVLQVDGFGKGHQLVEHLRAVRQLLVVGAVLV